MVPPDAEEYNATFVVPAPVDDKYAPYDVVPPDTDTLMPLVDPELEDQEPVEEISNAVFVLEEVVVVSVETIATLVISVNALEIAEEKYPE